MQTIRRLSEGKLRSVAEETVGVEPSVGVVVGVGWIETPKEGKAKVQKLVGSGGCEYKGR